MTGHAPTSVLKDCLDRWNALSPEWRVIIWRKLCGYAGGGHIALADKIRLLMITRFGYEAIYQLDISRTQRRALFARLALLGFDMDGIDPALRYGLYPEGD